jgi:hypothetical protein
MWKAFSSKVAHPKFRDVVPVEEIVIQHGKYAPDPVSQSRLSCYGEICDFSCHSMGDLVEHMINEHNSKEGKRKTKLICPCRRSHASYQAY